MVNGLTTDKKYIKMVLDDTHLIQVIDGTLSTSPSLLMPDIVTNGNAILMYHPNSA